MTKRHDVRVGSRAPENGGPAPFPRPASCAVTAPPVYPTWAPSVSSLPTYPKLHRWPALSLSSKHSTILPAHPDGVRPSPAAASHEFFERAVETRLNRASYVAAPEDGRTPSLLPAFSQWEKEIGRPAACPSQAPRQYAIPHARLLLPKGEGRKTLNPKL